MSKRSVSFKFEALVESGELAYLQQIMEDENLPKLAHNKQADRAIWEAQVGPIKGRFLDSMLLHHAVCPGIDHELQQVASQYLCVPPWKVQHAQAIKEHEEKQREDDKAVKAIQRAAAKAARMEEHNARNAAKRAEREAKKVERIAAHEARNAKSRRKRQLNLFDS
jgi:DNA polymerase I-like protein with 3'-5' exonuclease and polymerase domains